MVSLFFLLPLSYWCELVHDRKCRTDDVIVAVSTQWLLRRSCDQRLVPEQQRKYTALSEFIPGEHELLEYLHFINSSPFRSWFTSSCMLFWCLHSTVLITPLISSSGQNTIQERTYFATIYTRSNQRQFWI